MGNLKHTQMKVWKDLWTGDEMLSDSYPMKMLYGDEETGYACIEVKAKMVQKGSDFVAIAADDEAGDEEGESVINLVDAHKLQELELSKKNAMQMIKALMKKTASSLSCRVPPSWSNSSWASSTRCRSSWARARRLPTTRSALPTPRTVRWSRLSCTSPTP